MKKRQKTPATSVRRKGRTQARLDILSAAERMFARDGLAGARTDDIAAEAGVNKALLYYYFSSKELLYEAVLEEHFSEFNQKALAVLGAPGSPREILLRYVGMHFDFISSHHRYAALFQQLMTAGGPGAERLARKYFAPRSKAFDRLIERGMREGQFRKADRFHTAISIVSLIVFYFSAAPVLQLLGTPDAYTAANLNRRKQEVMDFVSHGLFTSGKKT